MEQKARGECTALAAPLESAEFVLAAVGVKKFVVVLQTIDCRAIYVQFVELCILGRVIINSELSSINRLC